MNSRLVAEHAVWMVGPFMAVLATLLVSLYLLLRPPRDPIFRLVLPLSICLALWNLGATLLFGVEEKGTALTVVRWFYYPAVQFLPPIVFELIGAFTGRKLSRIGRIVLWSPALLLVGTIASGHYVRDMVHYSFGWYADGRTLPHFAWIAYYTILAAIAFVDLARAWKATPDPYRRNQCFYVAAALVTMIVGGTSSLVPLFGIPFYPFGNLLSIPFIGTFLWILARYRLIEFPVFLGRLLFGLFLGVGSIAAGAFSFLALRRLLVWFLELSDPALSAWAAAIAALFAASLVFVGHQFFDPRLRRWLSAKQEDRGYELLEEGRDLLTVLDPQHLNLRLATLLHHGVGALSAALARYDDTTSRIRVEGAFGPEAPRVEGMLVPIPPAVAEWLGSRERAVFAADLEGPVDGLEEADREALAAAARRLEAELVLPLVVRGRLRGLLLIGPRVAGEPWGSREVRILGLLAQQVAVSYENARLYARLAESNSSLRKASDELAELARSLEEKVADRTRELEEANRRIQAADRLKSQFLANMSHELRTPLNSIIGFSEILISRLEGKLDPRQQKFLSNIHGSGQHLLGLINDLLDLSKIEAGRMELFPETFAIGPVFEGVAGVMKGITDKCHVEIVIEIGPGVPAITSDLVKFKQIVYNLLSNAAKFSPPGEKVTIRAARVGASTSPLGVDSLRVEIIDRGIGISRSDQEIIFDEFRQADGGSTRQYGGTGLGLALVRRFLEMQRGRIELESRVGQGSTFRFHLPIEWSVPAVGPSPPPEPTPREPAPIEPRRKGRILVVEDDPIAFYTLQAELEAEGFVTIRARHGEEGLRLVSENPPDLIVLDLILPGLDGWEVLKALKASPESREIPVVIVSMVENRELGLALGADDFFVKPVPREALLHRIAELTPGRRGGLGPVPKVLLIDDDPNVHELIAEELDGSEWQLVSALGGEEGLEIARRERPDVILLDLMMPGLSGFDVAAGLKADPATVGIPIVVLTAKEITSADRQLLGGKIEALFRKGAGARAALAETVRRLVDRRARENAHGD